MRSSYSSAIPRLSIDDAAYPPQRERMRREEPLGGLFPDDSVDFFILSPLALKFQVALADELLQGGREVPKEFFHQPLKIVFRNVESFGDMELELIIPHLCVSIHRRGILSMILPDFGQKKVRI
jgi:hypothetical protein